MATISTMAMLRPKTFTLNSLHNPTSARPTTTTTTTTLKPINVSLPSIQNKSILSNSTANCPSAVSAAIAGAVFSTLSSADAAFAAQRIADLAEGGDNRGLALLIPLVPAILWVLYNILQPALNQLERMRSEKGFVVGLGLGLGGGFAAAGLVYSTPSASAAEEVATMAAAAAEGSGDSRGLLLLFVVAPAIAWVLFNILQPALNQLNRMRSG
ncbi:photosystem II core complex proteins psbY, chloroplastic [Ananas comosus]|uniref:Photosystem II core complex proteins psbY, chloroplastic n=1 Tax=Ananas comosus TaxID=4615 RepID=A0A6P5F3Z3_ANACO|nr:photosystem II core complex proteins psbY, chloroplastic [Ananas comosus]